MNKPKYVLREYRSVEDNEGLIETFFTHKKTFYSFNKIKAYLNTLLFDRTNETGSDNIIWVGNEVVKDLKTNTTYTIMKIR